MTSFEKFLTIIKDKKMADERLKALNAGLNGELPLKTSKLTIESEEVELEVENIDDRERDFPCCGTSSTVEVLDSPIETMTRNRLKNSFHSAPVAMTQQQGNRDNISDIF